jgi:hypothetical protein
VNVHDGGEIERGVTDFARSSNCGLIVTGSALAAVHKDLIISLAARHNLPAVYFERQFVTADGLMFYGPNIVDQYRLAAGYVDRILKGEKPADLPVQASTKYELVTISRPRRRSASRCLPPCLPAPTRYSSNAAFAALHESRIGTKRPFTHPQHSGPQLGHSGPNRPGLLSRSAMISRPILPPARVSASSAVSGGSRWPGTIRIR